MRSVTGINYAPAKGTYGLLLFEDLWPASADYDYNDQNIAYQFTAAQNGAGQTVALSASLNVLSVGASLSNGLYLHLPVPANSAKTILLKLQGRDPITLAPEAGETDLVIKLVDDTRSLFGGEQGFLNTTTTAASISSAPMSLQIGLAQPVALDMSTAPFDLFIARTGDAGHQVHQAQYAGTSSMNAALFNTGTDGSTSGRHFINQNGLPFALNVPQVIEWPQETISIERVYPDVTGFATSGGTQHADWYLTNRNDALAWSGGAGNTPPPAPADLSPDFAAQQTSCSTPPSLAVARYVHTATTLSDGRVLIAGGIGSSGYLSSAEIYDPATNAVTPAGSMSYNRIYATAVLLPSGKVLISGGYGYNFGAFSPIAASELWDPATNAFTPAASMSTTRYVHDATLLANGKVLVTAGYGLNGFKANAEVYAPATDSFSSPIPMNVGRYFHSSTLLGNGQVVIAGGYGNTNSALSSVEVYDPATNAFTSVGGLITTRYSHTTTLLASGKLLVTGGAGSSGWQADAELYDPATNSPSAAGSLAVGRAYHRATLLPNGRVLLSGGNDNGFLASVELYDPASNSFSQPIRTLIGASRPEG